MTTLPILPQGPEFSGRTTRTDRMARTAHDFAAILGVMQNGSEMSQAGKRPQGVTKDNPPDAADDNRGPASEGHMRRQPDSLRVTTEAADDPFAAGKTMQGDSGSMGRYGIEQAQEPGALDQAREMIAPLQVVEWLPGTKKEPGSVRVDLQKLIWSGEQNPDPLTDHASHAAGCDRHGVYPPEQAGEPPGLDPRSGTVAMTPKLITTSKEQAVHIPLERDQAGLPQVAIQPEFEIPAGNEGFQQGLSTNPATLSALPPGSAVSHRMSNGFREGSEGLPKLAVPPSETSFPQASASIGGEAATEVVQTVLANPGFAEDSTASPGVSLGDVIVLPRAVRDSLDTGKGARSLVNTAPEGRIPMPTAGIETDILQDRMLQSTPITQEHMGEDEPPALSVSGRVDQVAPGAVSLRDPMSPAPVLTALAQRLGDALRKPDQNVIRIQLAPAELGRLRIILNPTETGIHLVIQSERPETQELLRRNLGELARDLADLGFEDLSFDFSDQQERGHSTQFAPRVGASRNVLEVGLSDPLPAADVSAGNGVGGLDLRV